MQLAFVAALLAAGAVQSQTPAAPGGLGFGPLSAYFKLHPGEMATQIFTVKNFSKRAVHLTLFHEDAWHDEEGRRIFPEAGTTARGLGKWLSAPKPDRIRIAGGAIVEIEQSVTVPETALPGTYLGGLMARLDTVENDLGVEESAAHISAGAKMNSVVAMLVHVDVKNPDGALPAPELVVAGQEMQPPSETTPLVVKLRLLNKSDWEVKPSGTLAVFDSAGHPAGKAAFDAFPIWPGQLVWLSAAFSELLKPGKYRALAAFSLQDPGNDQITYPGPPVKMKFDFEVKPVEIIPPPPRGPEPSPAVGKQGT